MTKISKFLLLFLSFFPLFSNVVSAQSTKSYYYDSIKTNIALNRDSTFDAEENQTFHYKGNFHVGWRSIPKNKFDTITDIVVVDGETGKPLIYSNKRLTKEDPGSWGKYTYFKQNGIYNIEWYYNLTDTVHTWILKYKVHGGIEFNKSSDRLYWNLFTDYNVPVSSAEVNVSLPSESHINYESYRGPHPNPFGDIYTKVSVKSIYFKSLAFDPREPFTVDISWDKGIVSQSAYWADFFRIYYGYILSVLIFLFTLIAGFIRWLITEKFPEEKQIVVPEYTPPQNLKPAIAEVITKETITSKGLAATIIDLAVRGYLKIEEEKDQKFLRIFSISGGILVLMMSAFLGLVFSMEFTRGLSGVDLLWRLGFATPLILLVVLLFTKKGWEMLKGRKDYVVSRISKFEKNDDLDEYEERYLNALFAGKNYFSTSHLKNSTDRSLYEKIKKVKELIFEKASGEKGVYEVDFLQEKKMANIYIIMGVLSFLIFYIGILLTQFFVLIITMIACFVGFISFIKYEARLSAKGIILKKEWLGFKLYLETADKYDLQNLTPDKFQKYLPYAMIFGVEKKWAKAFDNLSLPPPAWYGGYYVGSSGSSFVSSGGFSPSSFSSSFSSSFNSAFSSGAGGGGGAG